MKEFKIKADPNNKNAKRRFTQEIQIVLGDDIENLYDAAAKDLPDNLPATWTPPGESAPRAINWISNFGLSKKDGKQAERILPGGKKYTIRLQKVEGIHVYYDGSQVKKLNTRSVSKNPNLVEADLDLGDPPTGWMGNG